MSTCNEGVSQHLFDFIVDCGPFDWVVVILEVLDELFVGDLLEV